MLKITIPAQELYDERENVFINTREVDLVLEHSLVSLSKWEAKYKKPFLTRDDKTREETIDYVKCMTITQNIEESLFGLITQEILDVVSDYIDNPMTATTFNDTKQGGGREIITSEIIYFWLINFNIPFECQKWHLNRLLALIKVCNIKNSPKGKLKRSEILARNRSLNAERKKKLNTTG